MHLALAFAVVLQFLKISEIFIELIFHLLLSSKNLSLLKCQITLDKHVLFFGLLVKGTAKHLQLNQSRLKFVFCALKYMKKPPIDPKQILHKRDQVING